jgi:hypothetical protein
MTPPLTLDPLIQSGTSRAARVAVGTRPGRVLTAPSVVYGPPLTAGCRILVGAAAVR